MSAFTAAAARPRGPASASNAAPADAAPSMSADRVQRWQRQQQQQEQQPPEAIPYQERSYSYAHRLAYSGHVAGASSASALHRPATASSSSSGSGSALGVSRSSVRSSRRVVVSSTNAAAAADGSRPTRPGMQPVDSSRARQPMQEPLQILTMIQEHEPLVSTQADAAAAAAAAGGGSSCWLAREGSITHSQAGSDISKDSWDKSALVGSADGVRPWGLFKDLTWDPTPLDPRGLSWQEYRKQEKLLYLQRKEEQQQQAAAERARPHHRLKLHVHRATAGCGLSSNRGYELLLYDHITEDVFATVMSACILLDEDAGVNDSAAAAAVLSGRLLFDGWVKIVKPDGKNDLPPCVQRAMYHNELAAAEDYAPAAAAAKGGALQLPARFAQQRVLPALWAVVELAVWYGYEGCYCLLAPASTSVDALLQTDMYKRRQQECWAQQQKEQKREAEEQQLRQDEYAWQRRQKAQRRQQQLAKENEQQ